MANFCMNCGVPVEPAARFCIVCGQELEQEQAEIQQGSCPESGPVEYTVEQNQQPQQYQPPQQYQQPQQYQYPQQPLYAPPPYPQAVAKKKSKLPLILGIAGGIVVLIILTVVLVLFSASATLSKLAKANFYEIGGDEVSSIKLALGEQRTIVGISTSTKKGVTTKEITFSVDGSEQNEDMIAYANCLLEEDFLLLTDIDFTGPEGEGALGRNSIEEGYCILVELEYDDTGYVITLIRKKGEIEPDDTAGADLGQGDGQGSKPDPGAGSDPVPDPGTGSDPKPDPIPSSDPKPAPNPGSKPVIVAQSAIDIFDSGCFHLIGTFEIEGQESAEMETYRNGDKAALFIKFNNTVSKTIIKDGKVYYIVDDLKSVYVSTTDLEGIMPEYGSASMTYIGEGSGDFNGKTYPYSEYEEKDGGRSYYFMEGNSLKGISVMSGDVSIFEQTILTLDTKVPDDVFAWPSSYKVIDSPA